MRAAGRRLASIDSGPPTVYLSASCSGCGNAWSTLPPRDRHRSKASLISFIKVVFRFSSQIEENRKTTLMKEISEAFDRWRSRGGNVDQAFPHPLHEAERYTVGGPESIEASLLPAALICQRCGQLVLDKKLQRADRLRCPHCESQRIHQLPFVFVHGCGELVPIQEWLPAIKKNAETGGLEA